MEGVYVLWDGSGFYIGETGDLDERMKFHRREGRELLAFVPVEGGAFARRRLAVIPSLRSRTGSERSEGSLCPAS